MKVIVWWLSSPKMTVKVVVSREKRIVEVAPIVQKFVGQHISKLIGWMELQGEVDIEVLKKK